MYMYVLFGTRRISKLMCTMTPDLHMAANL